jgi:hypothetical protein
MPNEHRQEEERARRQSQSAIAPGADAVEPRDPATRPVGSRSTALMFLIPAVLIVLIGLAWMVLTERNGEDDVQRPALEGSSQSGERPDGGQ